MTERNPEKIRDFLGTEICEALPESFRELHERITYIIIKFLQSEDKILFLRFPIEDLTNKENKKSQYWDEICDVIAYAIRLSMKSNKLDPSELSYPGEWYRNGDNFLLLSSGNDQDPYYFLQAENKRLAFSCVRRNFLPTRTTKYNIIQNAKAIYELVEIPGQIKKGYSQCCKDLKLLECRKFENDQLSSAVAICPAYSRTLTHAGTYVKPIVEIQRTNLNYPDSDIIAIVGDKAFDLVQVAINSLRGVTKKVIAFGTEPTAPLTESNPVTITLTFREMHEYCAPKRVGYCDPEFIEIDFPWLKNVLTTLRNILEEHGGQVGDTVSKHIYNLTRSILSDIEFSNKKLDRFKEYFVNFIDNRIDEGDAPELHNKIMEWLDGLSYDECSNPKQNYANKKSAKVILSDRSIPKQLKGKETYGSSLVLDSPNHDCLGVNNPISTVMRYHLFPKLSCLYYKDIETPIMDRTKRNLKNDPFFSADVHPDDSNPEESKVVKLEDYFDLDTYQRDFYSLVYGGEKIIFTDGSREQLSGDVILSLSDETLKRIPVTNILDKEGKTIIFYSQNAAKRVGFKHLFHAYHDFPEGKDVDYYVNLWQKALKTLAEQAESLEALCEELKITKAVLKNHIEGRSKFMTRSRFVGVLDLLVDKDLIKEEESGFIKAAQNFYNKESVSFGFKLKDALYRFRIDETDKSDFLIKLEKKTGYSASVLVEEFLYEKTIKE